MRTSKQAACAGALILAVFSCGCGGAKTEAAGASARSDGIHEYRAVCAEKEAHGGTEYVLSKWLEIRNDAQALGDYHSQFKDKGHRIRIEERVKAQKTTP